MYRTAARTRFGLRDICNSKKRMRSCYSLNAVDDKMRSMWLLMILETQILAAVSSLEIRSQHKALDLTPALELFAQIPTCAQNCILSAGSEAGCSVTDIQCSCDSQNVNKQSTDCVLANCTMRQALVTKNNTQTMCGRPIRDTTRTIQICATIYQVAESVAYLLRIGSKVHIQWPWNGPAKIFTQLWWDDVVITAALFMSLSEASLARPISSPGLGQDVWTLLPYQVDRFVKLFFYGELLYIVGLSTVKVSICLSYLRFFSSRKFRKLVYFVILLNLLYMIGFLLPTIFQCKPVSYWWKEWDGEREGHCIAKVEKRLQGLVWTSSAFNILLDIIVLGMPVPLVWKMELNKRKKVLVIFMFTCGLFITAISILRLQSLVKFGETINPTWDYRWMARWSTIELAGMVVCACMPGMRNFIRRIWPEAVGETTRGAVESIQPGLYEPKSSIRTGASQTDDIENLVSCREQVRLEELATATQKRTAVRWSKASIDVSQLQQIAGWNLGQKRLDEGSSEMQAQFNATAPLDTVLNATAPLDDDLASKHGSRRRWSWSWLPWKRASGRGSTRNSRSSQLTPLSTRRTSAPKPTAFTSTTGSSDVKSDLKSQPSLTPSTSVRSAPSRNRSPSFALPPDTHVAIEPVREQPSFDWLRLHDEGHF